MSKAMSKRRTSAKTRRLDVDPTPTRRPPTALQCGAIHQALREFLKRDPHPYDDPAFPAGDDWVANYRRNGLRSLGFALYDADLTDRFRAEPANNDSADLVHIDLAGAAAILLRIAIGVAERYRIDPDRAPPRSVEFGPEVRDFLLALARVDPDTFNTFATAVTAAISAVVGNPAAVGAIEWLDNMTYRVSGTIKVVTGREDMILQAFLGRPALTLPGLTTRSGLPADSIPSIVRSLRTKYQGLFRDALRTPGGKGKGGYTANVIDARNPKSQA
jgi:hypothetical protein